MRFISVKCPECNAQLSIKNDKSFFYCEYCGTKLILHDNNKLIIDHTYRKINEAEVIRANTERYIALEQLKLEKEKRQYARNIALVNGILNILKYVIKTFIILFLLFLTIIGIIAAFEGPEELGIVGIISGAILFFIWDNHRNRKT